MCNRETTDGISEVPRSFHSFFLAVKTFSVFFWVESLNISFFFYYGAHKIVWYTCEWWMINVMANVSMYNSYIHFVNKFELPVLVVVCMNIWHFIRIFQLQYVNGSQNSIRSNVIWWQQNENDGGKDTESGVSIEFEVLRMSWKVFPCSAFLTNWERRVPTQVNYKIQTYTRFCVHFPLPPTTYMNRIAFWFSRWMETPFPWQCVSFAIVRVTWFSRWEEIVE